MIFCDKKHAPTHVTVGDEISVSSRGKKAWCAKLGDKNKKFGREREFLRGSRATSGMSNQIITYTFTIDEPGDYEVAGDEFGEFRHTFTAS